jgi:hypothetical protein
MRRKWIFIVPAALVGMALVAFIGGELVKQLWNGLLPPLFGFPVVSFWQALGLLALCRILVGGMGGRGCRRHTSRMSDEERGRVRARLRERFGFHPEPPAEAPGP